MDKKLGLLAVSGIALGMMGCAQQATKPATRYNFPPGMLGPDQFVAAVYASLTMPVMDDHAH